MTVTEDRPDTHASSSGQQPGPPTAWWLPASLIAVTIALIAAGVIFLVQAGSADDAASDNGALVDRSQTTEVISQVSAALNQVLSFDFRKPQAAEAAAKRTLTGDAPAQYQVLLKGFQTAAKGQQLTLVAKVTSAGVTSLRGNRAQLLVFLDQRSVRASDNATTVGAARVQVAAVRNGDTWRIDQIKPI